MTVYAGKPASEFLYELPEGLIWDDRAERMLWVDIWEGRVLTGDLVGDRIVQTSDVHLGETAGAVAVAEDGGLLVAAARRLATVSPSGAVSFGPDLLGERQGIRFNDGSADPFGSFVVGTLTIGGDTGEEQLLRISVDGNVEVLRDGLRLSNGIAFSPDGGTIYHVDTFARTISSHSYNAGPIDPDEPWLMVLDERHLPNYPDGLTVDAAGALWVAQWNGSCVRRFAPTGELLDIVSVDAALVSCPAFVGRDLSTLAISTSQEGLTEITDGAGAIFLAEVESSGMPPHRWAGSTATPYWLLPESEHP